jgi:hypothetical protein
MNDTSFVDALHREICSEDTNWALPGLLATLRLAWALTIHTLTQYSVSSAGNSIYLLWMLNEN